MLTHYELATDKQTSYLRSLLESREMPADSGVTADRLHQYITDGKITKLCASQWIRFMKGQPEGQKIPTQANDFPNVPAGRYALRALNVSALGNEILFYKIDRPTEGKWAGRLFVKRMESDEEILVKDTMQRSRILARIAEDPEGASALYGREIGCCGICNKTLTNDESRARGIGPVCAGKVGW